MKQNPIVTIKKGDKLKEADVANHYREIDMQSKMVNNLFIWLPLLEKLRETKTSEKKIIPRGEVEVNGMFASKLDK